MIRAQPRKTLYLPPNIFINYMSHNLYVFLPLSLCMVESTCDLFPMYTAHLLNTHTSARARAHARQTTMPAENQFLKRFKTILYIESTEKPANKMRHNSNSKATTKRRKIKQRNWFRCQTIACYFFFLLLSSLCFCVSFYMILP